MSRPPYGRKSPTRTHRQQLKSKRRRPLILDTLFAMLILSGIAFLVSRIPQTTDSTQQWTGIATTIDGDTIILQQQRLRLKGIDAPEMKQTCRIDNQEQACGVSAKQALQQKTARQIIYCTSTARDKYKRFLANCYLGQTDLNQWLVEEGHAVSYYDYPAQEHEARANKRGIWAGEFELPQEWRKRNTTQENDEADETYFDFKGLILVIQQIYQRLFNSDGTDE
ncbi:thermonuclease family protein [Paenochrobactrum glaciei]|uniref:Thermonuclease family protein n=1 Tax=Paenochrobactrum glaciei TaxID=486407 RepID=A0ABN1G2N4_9HYPH